MMLLPRKLPDDDGRLATQLSGIGRCATAIVGFASLCVPTGPPPSLSSSRKASTPARRVVPVECDANTARAEALSALYVRLGCDTDTLLLDFQDEVAKMGRPSRSRVEDWLRTQYERELPVEWAGRLS
jgi:hypothetical protein